MRQLPFGEHVVDALFDGRVAADDAPPGFEDVARLIRAAQAPAAPGELAAQGHVVATLAAAVRTGASEPASAGVAGTTGHARRPVLARLVTAKVAAAAAVTLLGGGMAAAATGSLPAPLQTNVSRGLSAVGISVPSPTATTAPVAIGSSSATSGTSGPGTAGGTGTTGATGGTGTTGATGGTGTTGGTSTTGTTGTASGTGTTGATGTAGTSGTSSAQAVGPKLTGPALYGLCTAASHGSQAAGHSVAFRHLSAAAAAKGETVAQYCAGVTPPPSPTSGGTTRSVPGGATGTAGGSSGTVTDTGTGTGNGAIAATAGLPGATGTPSVPGRAPATDGSASRFRGMPGAHGGPVGTPRGGPDGTPRGGPGGTPRGGPDGAPGGGPR